MGNPSDGFNGKTIALSIKNFWADVSITPSSKLVRQVNAYVIRSVMLSDV